MVLGELYPRRERDMNDKVILRTEHLSKFFPYSAGLFKKKNLVAVKDVSLDIHEGETIGLVGESGCGKSTLGRMITGIIPQSEGKMYFNGEELDKEAYKKHVTDIQMIFQDPLSSLNPRMTIFEIIAEPLRVCKTCDKDEIKDKVYHLMDEVGIRKDRAYCYPHEFSGGQCQRVGIARAMALDPKLIICDEPVSALDVSIKAQIINMFADLQETHDVSYLFITHDLLTVRCVAHRIAVMYLGHIVELAQTDEIYDNPLHPYTKVLLSAIAVPDVDKKRERIKIKGEIPDPANAPSGCPFRTRCKYATDKCAQSMPELKDTGNNHFVACFLTDEDKKEGGDCE